MSSFFFENSPKIILISVLCWRIDTSFKKLKYNMNIYKHLAIMKDHKKISFWHLRHWQSCLLTDSQGNTTFDNRDYWEIDSVYTGLLTVVTIDIVFKQVSWQFRLLRKSDSHGYWKTSVFTQDNWLLILSRQFVFTQVGW